MEFKIVELNNGAMSSAGGVESKQYYAKVIHDNPTTRDSTVLVDKMTPKEKANQLFNKFYSTSDHPNSVFIRNHEAKINALFVVDEFIIFHSQLERKLDTIDGLSLSVFSAIDYSLEYWEDFRGLTFKGLG